MKINVEFDNLTEAQAVALEEFFAVWGFLREKNMRCGLDGSLIVP